MHLTFFSNTLNRMIINKQKTPALIRARIGYYFITPTTKNMKKNTIFRVSYLWVFVVKW